MALLRKPDKATNYGIDLRRVRIGDHGMGGMLLPRAM